MERQMARRAGGGKYCVEGCRFVDALDLRRKGYLQPPARGKPPYAVTANCGYSGCAECPWCLYGARWELARDVSEERTGPSSRSGTRLAGLGSANWSLLRDLKF